MELSVIIFLLAVLLVGGAILGVVLYTKRSGSALSVAKYQSRWLSIESSLDKNQPATYSMAILNADKLLDMALRESGYRGQTMGERMKAANNTWKKADYVWGAHKIRNKIAHETDVNINYETAIRTLAAFKQGLKDLGAFDG